MKKNKLKRLVSIAFAYFLIFVSLFLLWKEVISGNIMIEFILFPMSFFILALYIVFYKKNWVVLPAKIIFSTILLITFFVLRGGYYFEYSDIIRFLPSAFPLIYLYKNDFKKWLIFLKNQSFINFKKISEISSRDYTLIFLGIIIIFISITYNFLSYGFWHINSYYIFILILIIFYLLSKNSLLKIILRVFILIWCAFSFREIFQLIIYDGLHNIKWLVDSNNLTEGILISINSLLFPLFSVLTMLSKEKMSRFVVR
ncbi:hypothetical protein M0Q39_03840 [Patescibacteria group bacterium]|nr:hypothetical protein [Patescibacteria group bacterium]